MNIRTALFIALCFSYLSCTDQNQVTHLNTVAQGEITILIFKEEKKGEVWMNSTSKNQINSFHLETAISSLPIGQFDSKFIENQILNQVDFLKKNQYSISQYIIFPNDNRASGDFTPCFACPHYMVETYAQLELLINEFPSQN